MRHGTACTACPLQAGQCRQPYFSIPGSVAVWIVPPQTYENMPTLTGAPGSMAFSFNGTFTIPLAVGGTGGFQYT